MDDIKRKIDQYVFPAIMIVLGLILLIAGSASYQNGLFLLGGGAILMVGILSVLYNLGIINKIIHFALLIILLGTCSWFAYQDVRSIKDPIDFAAERDVRYDVVAQRLSDIRDAEVEYRKKYNRYTSSWDTLIHFVQYDSIMEVYSEGHVPDGISQLMADSLQLDYFDLIVTGLTEWQCIQLARMDTIFVDPNWNFKRDTFYLPVEDELFMDSVPMSKRDHPYYLDSLPYVPFTGARVQFGLTAGFIEKGGGNKAPVFMAIDAMPFDSAMVYQVGSMDETSTNGNWKKD
jgi:uncharacterized membrane protein